MRKVVDQLRSAGVIEAIRIARASYADRLPHAPFARRFGVLVAAEQAKSPKQICVALVAPARDGKPAASRYAVGRTVMYFKAGVLEQLEVGGRWFARTHKGVS